MSFSEPFCERGHTGKVIPNSRKVNGVQQTQTLPMVHSGLHALEITNFNVVANNLLKTCLKSLSLLNSIIFLTQRHLPVFLTLCNPLKFKKM